MVLGQKYLDGSKLYQEWAKNSDRIPQKLEMDDGPCGHHQINTYNPYKSRNPLWGSAPV